MVIIIKETKGKIVKTAHLNRYPVHPLIVHCVLFMELTALFSFFPGLVLQASVLVVLGAALIIIVGLSVIVIDVMSLRLESSQPAATEPPSFASPCAITPENNVLGEYI